MEVVVVLQVQETSMKPMF